MIWTSEFYHDGYKDRIEALISSKMKRRGSAGEIEKREKPAAKSVMEDAQRDG